ncbi:tRNA glutamyl-Q synthetase [Mucilaginibacter mali]|uniref:tRNA glutamyl-Q synthetase n=1 Tax=Mucilaginibacter mali TaxID=2740462 RepID=A0A7D4TPS2_9SPHI|nr:glutamate--tRNA ligase family protein [Mucilaginibacter mali]QKJ32053.1 tRNA glutamyl-Q synthetase [Mucilaginibacter mali]
MDQQPVYRKTRIAPTPSGYLHLGNVLSFAITAALAEKTGAKILLRIDDLDRERVQPNYVQDIFDTLNFLDIPWHEGPRNFDEYEREWSQVHRMDMYRDALQTLKENDAVFACNCSRAQIRNINTDDTYPATCLHQNIPLDAENISWRLKTDINEPITVKNISGDSTPATLPANMPYFVIRKKDGYPAYQLTSVLDDLLYGIDLIVRGADLWASTLAQQYLAPKIDAHSFNDIVFFHHPLLMSSGQAKLSKSSGATSVHYLRNEGRSPADIFTAAAALLGKAEPISTWQQLAALALPMF